MIIQFFLYFPLLFYCCQCQRHPPVIIEQPQDIIAELDKPMAIHCRAEASSLDDLQIDWYKDGRLVTMDPNARIITEFMALHVINTMPQDAGVYYCIAKNSYGQTQSRKARIEFLKLDKDFVVSPISTSAIIGDRIRLRCQPPHGSPTPIVYWTKDGKNLSLPLDHYDLVLPSIQKSDFGTYRCVASNGLLRLSSPAIVTEFHRPKIFIQPSASRIDLRRGQSIHLKCHIDDEHYEVEWHFRDEIIPNTTIDISSIEFAQSGIYTCMGRFGKYSFAEQILLAVYDQEIFNHQERIFSQSNVTVFLGQVAVIDCQLPLDMEKKISWTMVNQSKIEKMNNDSNQYRLKIHRIREVDDRTIWKCSYQNQSQSSEGLIQLHLERIKPPPIISYVPNNQTVPIGVEVVFSCEPQDQSQIQWWFIPSNRPYKMMKIDNNRKYRIDKNHDLVIRHAEKNDAGAYKCVSTNYRHDETTWTGYLYVEDARSNAIFRRVERKDLPPAPSPPIATTIHSNSIELTWTSSSVDILNYMIEYYAVNSNQTNLQWERFTTKTTNSRQMITDLQSDSIYQFFIRARNTFGYGLPSMLSELIETKTYPQSPSELIYLSDPINIQQTSVTIKWNLLGTYQSIKQFSLYITNIQETNERMETISNSQRTYTINNLQPYTDYSIRLVPILDPIGPSSNTIIVRTLESSPSASPTNVLVQLLSTTSLSVQWNPPLENETHGQIIAYKVNCLSVNETISIRLTNISSDTKGLLIKNLIENMEYCISIAARTQIGYGPYSSPICVVMNEKFFKLNSYGLKYHLREALTQPWFLPVIILSSMFFTCAFSYAIWLCLHHLIDQHPHRMKFLSSTSSSSSNHSVELPVQKTLNNGKRYDLIQDPASPSSTAVWMNSIPNSIRLQCCTTATTASVGSNNDQYSINIHKNPINSLLHESRQQQQQQQQLNPYATTGIFQSSPLSNYSESIPAVHHQAQIPSPSTQYQPPWMDHQSSSTLQYRSQSITPYHCVHCTSQSHPHTPVSIRTTLRSPSSHRQTNVKSPPMDTTLLTMNSSPLKKLQSSNPIMINSLGGETMTTSWASSVDDRKHEIISPTSPGKTEPQQNQLASNGSILSDRNLHQQEEANTSALVNFERGPSFLTPNV